MRTLFVWSVLLSVATAASAETREFVSAKDNTMFQDSVNNAAGAGEFLFAGTTANGFYRRALMAFDLSSIPPGSIVQSATLRLYLDMAKGADDPTSLHRLAASWGEGQSSGGQGQGNGATAGDATWLLRTFGAPSSTWATPGGDFATTASRTILIGTAPGSYSWDSTVSLHPGLVADVQSWINTPALNFGWILIGDEVDPTRSAKRFFTREYLLEPEKRPTLTVTYSPAPPANNAHDVPLPPWATVALGAVLVSSLVRGGKRAASNRSDRSSEQ